MTETAKVTIGVEVELVKVPVGATGRDVGDDRGGARFVSLIVGGVPFTLRNGKPTRPIRRALALAAAEAMGFRPDEDGEPDDGDLGETGEGAAVGAGTEPPGTDHEDHEAVKNEPPAKGDEENEPK